MNMTKSEAHFYLEELQRMMTQHRGIFSEEFVCANGMAIQALEKAQEQRWIPVSEGLPKIDMSYPHHEDYLVQYDSGGMDVASWSNVNHFCTDHVTEPYWNCVQFAKVIAWMPLPPSYKEEQE